MRFELIEHGFDMLAGAQAVDAEIHALARELAPGQVADLHRIGDAALGVDLKVREDREAGVAVDDERGFLAGTEPTAGDFVLISGAPVVHGRKVGSGVGGGHGGEDNGVPAGSERGKETGCGLRVAGCGLRRRMGEAGRKKRSGAERPRTAVGA